MPASLMYFCSGQPMHFYSGVDRPLLRSGPFYVANLKSHTELDLHRWGLFLRNIFILRNFIWLWFWLNIRLLRRNVRLLTLRFWAIMRPLRAC